MNERNFHNFLRERTKENGSRLLFQKKDGWSWKQITWPDLVTEVESIACFLLNSGFSTGSRIIVLSPNTLGVSFFRTGGIYARGSHPCLQGASRKQGHILENSPLETAFCSPQAQMTRGSWSGDPACSERKVEKAFLSVNERVPVEEKNSQLPERRKIRFSQPGKSLRTR